MQSKPRPLLPLLLIAASFLTSCSALDDAETDPAPPSLSVACIVFQPITASGADTTETIRQIVSHNAAWDAVAMTDRNDLLSETEHESQQTDVEADILRCETMGEMVESAVLFGVDLQMSAYVGAELVTVTVNSEPALAGSKTMH